MSDIPYDSGIYTLKCNEDTVGSVLESSYIDINKHYTPLKIYMFKSCQVMVPQIHFDRGLIPLQSFYSPEVGNDCIVTRYKSDENKFLFSIFLLDKDTVFESDLSERVIRYVSFNWRNEYSNSSFSLVASNACEIDAVDNNLFTLKRSESISSSSFDYDFRTFLYFVYRVYHDWMKFPNEMNYDNVVKLCEDQSAINDMIYEEMNKTKQGTIDRYLSEIEDLKQRIESTRKSMNALYERAAEAMNDLEQRGYKDKIPDMDNIGKAEVDDDKELTIEGINIETLTSVLSDSINVRDPVPAGCNNDISVDEILWSNTDRSIDEIPTV